MSFSAKRWAYSDMPSVCSQPAIRCIAAPSVICGDPAIRCGGDRSREGEDLSSNLNFGTIICDMRLCPKLPPLIVNLDPITAGQLSHVSVDPRDPKLRCSCRRDRSQLPFLSIW